MKTLAKTFLLVTCIATATQAQMLPNMFFDGTDRYTAEVNEDGAILQSQSTILYLGKDCDAFSPQYGAGTWGWANAGFNVTFPKSGKFIGFARQESPVEERLPTLCRE